MEAERGVVAVIEREVAGLQRGDLFREPLVAFPMPTPRATGN